MIQINFHLFSLPVNTEKKCLRTNSKTLPWEALTLMVCIDSRSGEWASIHMKCQSSMPWSNEFPWIELRANVSQHTWHIIQKCWKSASKKDNLFQVFYCAFLFSNLKIQHFEMSLWIEFVALSPKCRSHCHCCRCVLTLKPKQTITNISKQNTPHHRSCSTLNKQFIFVRI